MESLAGPVEVSGQMVNTFIAERLLPVTEGQSVVLFSAAAITLILSSLRPTIDNDTLTQGIRDISSYITIWVSELDAQAEGVERKAN